MLVLSILNLVASLLILGILVSVAAFLVQFRQRVNLMFSDFVSLQENLFETIPVPISDVKDDRPKTWDEKYEEELEAMARRIKENSGLKDLNGPDAVSWGTPPAANVQNQDGLTIKENDTGTNLRNTFE